MLQWIRDYTDEVPANFAWHNHTQARQAMAIFFKKLANEHPTLLITLCYFLITLIGVVYSFFFYREFGINILKFADLSDFLLAAITEPVSIVIFLAVVVFALIAFFADFWLRNRLKGYGRWMKNKAAANYTDPVIFVAIVVVFVFFYVRNFAIYNADEIKAGIIDAYTVRFSDAGDMEEQQVLALLGSSNRFSYYFDHEDSSALVVPSENIAFMQKREADD